MSHPGIKGGKGSGQRGRPSKVAIAEYERRQAEIAEYRRRSVGALDWDQLVAAGLCECGVPLDIHPPLRKPGPLRSWKARKEDTRPEVSIWTLSR
jgi:hypothetical protein